MYCSKCGTENDGNSRFCAECGAELTQASAPVQQQTASQPNNTVNTNNAYQPQNSGYQTQTAVYPVKKKKSPLPIIIVIVVIAAVAALAFWVLSKPDLSVEDVKSGKLNAYQSETIGKAFEDYFYDCSWDEFTANDDVSISVVEFVGHINDYDGGKIEVTVQFIHDSDYQEEDEFEVYYADVKLSNGKVQTLSDGQISNMIDSVYNDYELVMWLW